MSSPSHKSPGPAWEEFAPLPQHAPDTAPPALQKSGSQALADHQRGCCRFCKSRRFLRSTLRSSDIVSLFFLRYPVRCLRCHQRQFADFLTASLSPAAGSPVYSEQKKRENWRTWTSGSDRKTAEALNRMRESQKSRPRAGNE